MDNQTIVIILAITILLLFVILSQFNEKNK